MALTINMRALEKDAVKLKGKLPPSDLDLEGVDELVKINASLAYDLEVQKLEQSILVQGDLDATLNCECSRCLKPFDYQLSLHGWVCHLPLEGEEKVEVINDSIDLTPFVREDILLGFPQHPLCEPECAGLPKKAAGQKKKEKKAGTAGQTKEEKSAWAELNKLKF